MQVTEYIRDKINSKMKGNVCFNDLQKAFDTLDHEFILKTLEMYGYQAPVLAMITNYLTDPQQYVDTNDSESDLKDFKTGAPQGSVLGPLRFLIYTNDLPRCSKKSIITMFEIIFQFIIQAQIPPMNYVKIL